MKVVGQVDLHFYSITLLTCIYLPLIAISRQSRQAPKCRAPLSVSLLSADEGEYFGAADRLSFSFVQHSTKVSDSFAVSTLLPWR